MFAYSSSLSLSRATASAAGRAATEHRDAAASRAGRFASDTHGGVAIMFALTLLLLCMFVGAAVDVGRWLQARHQTIAAMDAAVLAGGRMLQFNEQDLAGARAAAQKFYDENTKGRAAVIDDTVTFDAVDDGAAFAATGNAYIRTAFLGVANISKLPLLSAAQAEHSKALLRAGGQANNEVEISMMLDVTGSMSGSKIKDLKAAAQDLVNIVISESANANPVRVAVVPFAEGVRLPASANAIARGTPATQVSVTTQQYKNNRWVTVTTDYYPTECVVERAGNERYTDVAPGANSYVMTLFNRDGPNGNSGKCGLSVKDELMPLTNDKPALLSRIANLELSGMTAGQIGTAWAWYTLSPNWNSLWAGSAQARPYGDGTRKIAILMTDGEYNMQYDTRGLSTSISGAGGAANGDSTTQARSLCAAMKTKGITVYTVGFALAKNSTASATLRQCATDASMAYTPESGSELKQAFRDIALKINQLYLTQ